MYVTFLLLFVRLWNTFSVQGSTDLAATKWNLKFREYRMMQHKTTSSCFHMFFREHSVLRRCVWSFHMCSTHDYNISSSTCRQQALQQCRDVFLWDHQPIMDTFQPHLYDQSDDRESGTPSMWFHCNGNGQYSAIIIIKKVQCVVALHASYFLSLKSWLFQFQSCCLAVFLLPLAFLLSPITSLLRQPEQMFSNILLTKQANSGCY